MIDTEKNLEERPKHFTFAQGMAWLFLILSMFIFGYAFWRSEIVYGGEMRSAYFYFYLISFAGIVFWGVVLRFKDELRLNIVMASISFIVGLYVMEIYLAFRTPVFSTHRSAAIKVGALFDTRSKFEVIKDLRKQGKDPVPSVCFASLREFQDSNQPLFTLAGVSGKTTVVHNETGKYMIIQSDRHGFNNPNSVWDTSKTDWVLLGDSFTYGYAVQSGEEIGSQIRKLTNSSVISLGCGGNGPLASLAALKEYGEPKAPKRVLWLFTEGNDLIDLNIEMKNPQLMNYLQPEYSQDLINRQKEIDSALIKVIHKAETRKVGNSDAGFQGLIGNQLYGGKETSSEYEGRSLILRLHHLRNRIGFNPYSMEARQKQDFNIGTSLSDILKKARDRVAAQGGKLYFVFLPEFTRYFELFVDHDKYRGRSELIKIVQSLNIPVIDIHQAFKEHPDPRKLFPFEMGGHYNPEGYKLVAETIVKEVKAYPID